MGGPPSCRTGRGSLSFRRILAGAATAAVLISGVPATVHAATGASCWDFKRSEKKFARKVNRARARHGSHRLALDPQLSQVARRHAREMRWRRVLFHSDKLGHRVTNWRALGENVGTGYSVASIHRAFMHSPLHRENVMWRGFRHVGVGVTRSGGRLWVTVVFESRLDPGTTLRKPSC